MEAGGMIARARSSQTRNAENRLLISKVLEGYPIGQFDGCLLILHYYSIHKVCMIATFIDKVRQISDLVVSSS